MRMKKREKTRTVTAFLMFLAFTATVSAQSLSKKISVNFKNTPLPTALKSIGKQSGVRVEFAYDDVKAYKVNVNLKQVNAEAAVKAAISHYPLTYKVVGDKFIIISKDASHKPVTPSNQRSGYAQQVANDEQPAQTAQQVGKTVKGKVMDANHEPLPGVSIKCGNSRMGTYTDLNGEFSFTLPENHGQYLTFSYIGMQEQKVKISAKNSNHMQIVMHEDAGALDEVVITGYQVLDKRSLTSAVTSVKMKDLQRADMSSLDQMLEGKVPDLLVSNNSAEVGVAPKIRIRGTSTLIGNREPLWVVDGIVVTDPVAIAPEELNDPDYVNRIGNAISGINPQDIERIDVLKDAAATAIYGTKAANGVIVVTTKRGFEGKPQVSYSANVTYKRRPRYSDRSVDMMTSKERIQLSRDLYNARFHYDTSTTLVGYEKALDDLYNNNITYAEFQNQVSAMESQNTDWFDLLCQDSWSNQHTASLSGGSQKSRYYASLGYNRDNDVIKVNKNERYTASMNLDNTFNRLLTASFTFNGYHSKRHYYQDGLSPLNYAYTASRAINPFNADGTYAYYKKKITSSSAYNYNILNELDNSYKEQVTNSFTVSANLKFRFTDWLNANAIFSMTNQNTDMEGYWGEKTSYAARLRGCEYGENIDYPEDSEMPQGGELTKTSVRSQSYTARFQMDANKYFGEDDKHNIYATFGIEINSDKYKSYQTVARGYYPDRGMSFVTNIDPAIYTSYATWLSNNQPSIVDNLTNTFSTYLSLTYAYKSLWRVNLNGRVDGSNKFGDRSNDRFLPIWSLSGSYDLSKLLGKVKWMDYVNLKASYGFQGNMLDTESPLMTIRKGAKNTYYGEFVSTIENHPNPDLKWERTHSYNVGIDLSLFDLRLEMELSAYYKKTNDAFMIKKVSSVNGVSSYIINGGDVTNKGYSFDITYNAIRNKDFRWTLSTSISKVINSIDSKPDSQTYDLEDFLNGTAVVEGKAVNTFYSYKFLGLSPLDGGPLFDDYADNPAALRGLSKYDIFTTVLEASGKRDADIQGSLTNTFRYKNWRASISLGYSLGAKTRLFAMYGSAASGAAYGDTMYPEKNYSRDYLDRWQKPGDEKHTNIPALISYDSDAYYKYTRHWSTIGSYKDIGTIVKNYWDMYDYSNIRVVSADYLKLQSMSLTYEFPMNMLSHIGFQRIAVTASAYNLFCICDPDLKGQTPTQGGFSSIQLSDRPSFSLGLNVIF